MRFLVPPGGDPVLASWDRAFFYVANQNVYPSTFEPQAPSAIVGGWSLDYASSNPSFVVGIADGEGGPEESGYSTNGGQTWMPFPTDPPGAGANGDIGGTIAASTPSNIIWAPADGYQPYYTLNGGETWSPVVLPGVSSWSGFDSAYYYDTRTVTADRVLPNTFYLYYPGHGVYETTDGGVAWTQVYSGTFPGSGFNSELQSVPGEAGNLFYTSGPQGGAASPASSHPFNTDFYELTNGGATWAAVPNVLEVQNFGFGAPATLGGYPTIYIVGWVNDVYGIWQSTNDAKSWTKIGIYPTNSLNYINAISGDPNVYGQVYVGFAGAGFAEFTAAPAVTGVAASPSSGVEDPGATITLTLSMSEVVTVTGTPTLSLNDGGVATYTDGSGSNELIFSYTVSSTDHDVSGLGITQVNLPNGATIEDANGNAANLSGAVSTFSALQIDPPATVSSVVASGSRIANGTGDLNMGHVVTLTVNLSEVVMVNGTPTLTLNDGGTATYTNGSGTNVLTFSYKVASGQNTPDLAVTAVNLGTTTVTDTLGNAANLSGAVTTFSGLQIDTTSPTVSSVVATGSGISNGTGDLKAGHVVTLTINLSEAVTVANGTPTLTLNDGGTATYTGGSGTDALTFNYTVAAGQSTPALAVWTVNLGTATVTDAAGNPVNFAGALTKFSGLQIDATPPTVSSVVVYGSGITNGVGDVTAGSVVHFNVNMSEVVTVTGGTPTLALNDGGTATYTGGSGTGTLAFSYTVAAGQNTPALAVTAVNLGTASVTDAVGNAANFAGLVTMYAGLQIGANASEATVGATVTSIVASGSGITNGSGDLNAGHVVTLTVNLSEAVTVANGTPTLTLNDGGTATYVSGTGSSTLVFSYTVAAGQNTPDLAVTAVNLNSATITNGAGSAANLSGAITNPSGTLQVDTTPPTISSVTATAGDYDAGKVLTLTLNMSAAVNVGGTPTLTLNDGGTATYVNGSGSSTLVFSYTVAAGQNTTALQVTGVTGTITDLAGNALSTANLPETFSGVIVDTTPPTISSMTATAGDYDAGKVLTLTLNMSAAVNVGGTPTLTLNDGGTATYVNGSGSSTLVFSYTVAAGQNTTALQVTGVTGTITDLAGNALSTANLPETFSGVIVDTTPPTISSMTATAGDYDAGKVLTLTLNMSAAVNVGGTPTLTLNDGGTATYVNGSGSSTLVFSYTVAAGQNTTALQVTGVTGTITDLAGNALSTANLPETFSGVIVDTTPPTISSMTATTGDYDAGKVLTLTLNMSETVNVSGTPTLTLNDGGTATYKSGSGSNALMFTYTVAAGQNTTALEVTGITGTITDLAGNALSTANLPETFSGVIIDTTPPTVSTLMAIAGDYDAGKALTLTLNMSAAVNVTGSPPTLTLNDGGTATYVSGTGSSTLVFSYTVAAGQNTTALEVTGVTGTIADLAGNVLSTANLPKTFSGVIIDTTLPTVSSVTATAGDYDAGKVLTLTLNMSEVVNVTGSPPKLTLNDGGTATYVSGTGSSTLVFSYTVAAGQNTTALEVTGVTGTITDLAGNALSAANLPETFSGVIVDTTPPAAPVITSDTVNTNNSVTLSGTAAANSTVTVYDNQTALGTTIANASGAWTYTTGALASGSQTFTATATDAAGNTSAASNSVDPIIGLPNDDWKTAVSANWTTTADWSAGVPTSADLIVLNATGTYTVTSTANETIYELNTISTATLAISGGTFTITNGTGTGVQAGIISVAHGAILDLDGTFANSGVLLANGGTVNIEGAVTGGTTEIGGAGIVAIGLASSENVTFLASSTGELVLDTTSYTGTISGFGANTTQSIDLADINFAAGAKIVSYVANSKNTGGTLTITAGTNTIALQLVGTYKLANFAIKSDGSGGTLLTDPPLVEQMPGNAPATVANGAVLEINTPDKGSVTFAGTTGTLWLDQPSTFTGTVSGFKAQDVIDLSGMAFGAQTTLGYLPNSNQTGGTLSVTNGSQSANIALLGSYIASSFATESDNHGGTMVVAEASQTGEPVAADQSSARVSRRAAIVSVNDPVSGRELWA